MRGIAQQLNPLNRSAPMSTYPHCTLQSHDVYPCTINTLDPMPLDSLSAPLCLEIEEF